MASWRDTTSPKTQDEMDAVVESALDLATARLSATEDLAPFAVALTSGGEQHVLHALPSETPTASTLLEDLFRSVSDDRDRHVVVAVVFDVMVQGEDAVQVHVEHSDPSAPALVMALPYQRPRTGISFGALRAARAERRIWS